MTTRASWVVVACVVVTEACGGGAASTPFQQEVAPTRPSGAYRYVANLPRGQRLQGIIAVLRDTMLLEPSEGICRPGTSTTLQLTYVCSGVGRYEGVVFALDRSNVVQRSRWQAEERVQASRQVCQDWATTPTGQRVCRRYGSEDYETSITHQGTLQLTPRDRGSGAPVDRN